MWSGPLHNPEFVAKVVEHVDQNTKNYGTSTRMKGMLAVAQEVRARHQFFWLLIQYNPAGTRRPVLLHPRKSGGYIPLFDARPGRRCVRSNPTLPTGLLIHDPL